VRPQSTPSLLLLPPQLRALQLYWHCLHQVFDHLNPALYSLQMGQAPLHQQRVQADWCLSRL
jgi:hypothetical protein